MPFMTDCLSHLRDAAQAKYLAYRSDSSGTFAAMEIGLKIKRARQASGLSQRAFAGAIGVSAGLVGQWESHRGAPGRANLKKICEFLGVTADSLLSPDDVVAYRMTLTNAREVKAILAFRRLSRRQQDNLLELLTVAGDVADEMKGEREPAEA